MPDTDRRRLLIAAPCLALSACRSGGMFSMVRDSLDFAVGGIDAPPITRERIEAIPYASMTAKIGDGPAVALILASVNGQERRWIASDRGVLVTRGGRIVRTAGLADKDLQDTRYLTPDPLPRLGRTREASGGFRRTVDIVSPEYYGLLIGSRFEVLGEREITISEVDLLTVEVRERCRAETLDWAFENRHWVDPKHPLVWKSRQHVHPELPPLTIEILKPPAV